MSAFSVTQFAKNRFLVEGRIAVIGGRRVDEAYSRVFAKRVDAEYDARRWDRINAESLSYLEERRALRVVAARDYLAVRAGRGAAQFELFA